MLKIMSESSSIQNLSTGTFNNIVYDNNQTIKYYYVKYKLIKTEYYKNKQLYKNKYYVENKLIKTEYYKDEKLNYSIENLINNTKLYSYYKNDYIERYYKYNNDEIYLEEYYKHDKICYSKHYENNELIQRIEYYSGLCNDIDYIIFYKHKLLTRTEYYDCNKIYKIEYDDDKRRTFKTEYYYKDRIDKIFYYNVSDDKNIVDDNMRKIECYDENGNITDIGYEYF